MSDCIQIYVTKLSGSVEPQNQNVGLFVSLILWKWLRFPASCFPLTSNMEFLKTVTYLGHQRRLKAVPALDSRLNPKGLGNEDVLLLPSLLSRKSATCYNVSNFSFAPCTQKWKYFPHFRLGDKKSNPTQGMRRPTFWRDLQNTTSPGAHYPAHHWTNSSTKNTA